MSFPTEPGLGGKTDYGTPPALYDYLDRLFGFDLDAAAHAGNHKCPVWFGPDSPSGVYDALRPALEWNQYGSRIWLNFPYSRIDNARWVERAYHESRRTDTIVCTLQFLRPETQWWRNWISRAETVFLLTPRVQFAGAPSGAQVPSSVAVFTPWCQGPPTYRTLQWKGDTP